ncbi:hypothetical protein RO3G_05394 [Lichtheimia corymbifera JMRC:FSU:9682]|uniref:TNFR-Cys domain-containing protein n=2 Tax=Lichtheimia TaxID=688353 RepID=A0A068SD75_9FUNG|nr:uncharacterized protein O0I10_009053 [Lichtheimia ornata]KAJ8655185.1 hypothetical protein O0I10_009053 [Lichtheimia ornata]CDH60229.1 hypothetical protein RO3G_05394 [Lichtheimia corymbifera JMRC:FSU:9682]
MPSTPFIYWVLLSAWCILQCQAANPIFFCKCFCGSNSTIFEVPVLDSKPCSNCTKQFCLDNVQDGLCDGIADETCPSNDFRTSCFARDSYKDEAIVCTFLVLTGGLVVSAALKPYYKRWRSERAGYMRTASRDH